MEKNSRSLIISIVLNVVLLGTIICYIGISAANNKDGIGKLQAAIKTERNVSSEIDNNNSKLGQSIEGVRTVSKGLESTSGNIERINKGLESTNIQLREGIGGLQDFSNYLERSDNDNIDRISKAESILNTLENSRN